MNFLVGHECSGRVRDAIIALGHQAVSCDIKPSETPGPHIIADIMQVLAERGPWDGAFFFPDCTYVSVSGLHWNGRTPGRYLKTRAAIEHAEALWDCYIPRVVIENPVGCLSTMSKLMRPTQVIQPYQFEDDASKATCLWIRGFGQVEVDPSGYVEPRRVNGKPRWANQTDSGQNKLTPSEERAADRARTYPGIAKALARLTLQIEDQKP